MKKLLSVLLADRIENKPLEIAEDCIVTIDLNGYKIKSDRSLVNSDKDGSHTPFYGNIGKDETTCPWIKANVKYKTSSGDVIKEDKIDITWNKEQEMFGGTAIHYFDYFAKYPANFQIEDTPDGELGLADKKELKVNLYVNGNPVESSLKTYITDYEYVYGDGYKRQRSNDNNPIKQRILHATHYYRSEKAPVRKAVPTQISVQPGTTKDELIKLLPGSVNVEIADINYTNGNEQSETTRSPVVRNTDELPDMVTRQIEITGTLNTENEGFEVNGDNIQPTLIVDPITDGMADADLKKGENTVSAPEDLSVNDGERRYCVCAVSA